MFCDTAIGINRGNTYRTLTVMKKTSDYPKLKAVLFKNV